MLLEWDKMEQKMQRWQKVIEQRTQRMQDDIETLQVAAASMHVNGQLLGAVQAQLLASQCMQQQLAHRGPSTVQQPRAAMPGASSAEHLPAGNSKAAKKRLRFSAQDAAFTAPEHDMASIAGAFAAAAAAAAAAAEQGSIPGPAADQDSMPAAAGEHVPDEGAATPDEHPAAPDGSSLPQPGARTSAERFIADGATADESEAALEPGLKHFVPEALPDAVHVPGSSRDCPPWAIMAHAGDKHKAHCTTLKGMWPLGC